MEKLVVSGGLEQMENCLGFMATKLSDEGFEVVKLRVESAPSPTTLLQIRKPTAFLPNRMCASLKMSIVETGVSIESYCGTWFDNQKTSSGVFDSIAVNKLCKSIFLEAIAFFTRRENS